MRAQFEAQLREMIAKNEAEIARKEAQLKALKEAEMAKLREDFELKLWEKTKDVQQRYFEL